MNITIRKFQQDDFDSVLELMQKNFEFDFFTRDILKEKIFDDPYREGDLTWVAMDETKIIGFLQGVCREIDNEQCGYIKLLVVGKNYQRKGIARNMYLQLEKLLLEKKINQLRFGDMPMNYYMPGIDPRYTPAICFALRMGFKRFSDTSNLLVDLTKKNWYGSQIEKKLAPGRMEITRATEEDKPELMRFIAQEWKLWQHEVTVAYKENPIAIHIARCDGKIRAFSAHSTNNKGMPWFGPMGTHPDLRGKGIGRILLYRCLNDLKQQGYNHAIIPWVGPVDFYSHHAGAVVDRIFWRYEKQL